MTIRQLIFRFIVAPRVYIQLLEIEYKPEVGLAQAKLRLQGFSCGVLKLAKLQFCKSSDDAKR
jgi:hypothetical protein